MGSRRSCPSTTVTCAPEGTVDERHLAADDTTAHDDQALRHTVQLQGIIAAQDVGVVKSQTGQLRHPGAGRQDESVVLHHFHAAVGHGHFHMTGIQHPAVTGTQTYFETGAGLFQTTAQDADDLFLAGQHGGRIHTGRPFAGDAELGQAQGCLQSFGRSLEGLGGDAAGIEAGPAQMGSLHQRDFHARAGSGKSRRIAAGATTDDGQTFHAALLLR